MALIPNRFCDRGLIDDAIESGVIAVCLRRVLDGNG